MKRTLKGQQYNTETSKRIAIRAINRRSGIRTTYQELYFKRKYGKKPALYFLHTVAIKLNQVQEEDVKPVTYEEMLAWLRESIADRTLLQQEKVPAELLEACGATKATHA